MPLSVVDLKRQKWQSKTCSKLQNSRSQVSHQCLPVFSRVFSSLRFRRKQETTVGVEIPDDLVEEILHRLEVKSLVRLKSVSKGWKSLIESEHLAEKQLCLRQKKYGMEEKRITIELSLPRSVRIKYFSKYSGLKANNRESESLSFLRVAGSCNGLVCLYDLTYVYLINPKTRMIRTIDPPPQGGSKLSVGFGRDVVTGTYKVVMVYGFDYDDRVETIVFELGTSSKWRWRHETAGPMPLSYTPFTLINPKRNAVFANKSLFWLLTSHHSEILLVMDLHTEKFRTLSQPEDIISSGLIYMWSLEDRLCVSELRQGLDSDVWVLMQDEVSERWERSRFAPVDTVIPPLELNSAWFSPSLVSPYQSR